MRKTLTAALVACFAACSFSAPAAMADSITIKVKPHRPVVKKVIIRQPCYYKTVKKYHRHKVVIRKVRVCP